MRTWLLATALLLVFAGNADASCASSTKIGRLGGYAYVSSATCDQVACPTYGTVSDTLSGFFWKLGSGNPAVGVGDDSGTVSALNGFVYSLPSYGYNWIDADWQAPGVDGCAGSVAVNDCVAVVLSDRQPAADGGEVAMAVWTADEQGGAPRFPLPFGERLENVPQLNFDYPFFELLPSYLFSSPAVPTQYLDASCSSPLAGYKVYLQAGTGGLPDLDPTAWRLADGGSLSGGAPIPFGQDADVRFGCTHNDVGVTTIFIGHRVVFDSGFESPWVQLARVLQAPPACCHDADVDGYCAFYPDVGPIDCDDSDPMVGGDPPFVVRDVAFVDENTLQWTPGAPTSRVLVATAGASSDFCPLLTTTSDSAMILDIPLPGGVFAYLVQGQNGCGDGPLGNASSGAPRMIGASCP